MKRFFAFWGEFGYFLGMARKKDQEKLKALVIKHIDECYVEKDLAPFLGFPSYGAYCTYLHNYPKFSSFIKELWSERKEQVGQGVENELFKMIQNDEFDINESTGLRSYHVPRNTKLVAIMFYLKTQRGFRETDNKENTETTVIVE